MTDFWSFLPENRLLCLQVAASKDKRIISANPVKSITAITAIIFVILRDSGGAKVERVTQLIEALFVFSYHGDSRRLYIRHAPHSKSGATFPQSFLKVPW